MKLFYFLDFMHIKRYGAPVTYDTYINLEHGPVPSAIKNLIDTAYDDIDNSILADTIKFEKPELKDIHRIKVSRKFGERDRKYFSPTELDILEKVCQRFKDKNAKYIEDMSHKEAPWQETNFLDFIPYELAVKDDDCLVNEEEIKALLEI